MCWTGCPVSWMRDIFPLEGPVLGGGAVELPCSRTMLVTSCSTASPPMMRSPIRIGCALMITHVSGRGSCCSFWWTEPPVARARRLYWSRPGKKSARGRPPRISSALMPYSRSAAGFQPFTRPASSTMHTLSSDVCMRASNCACSRRCSSSRNRAISVQQSMPTGAPSGPVTTMTGPAGCRMATRAPAASRAPSGRAARGSAPVRLRPRVAAQVVGQLVAGGRARGAAPLGADDGQPRLPAQLAVPVSPPPGGCTCATSRLRP